MKQIQQGYVYYVKYDFAEEPILRWATSDKMGEASPEWILVGPHDFEVECPDDFDPRPQQVAALDTEIGKLMASITELQDRKNKLLALELSA